MTSADRDREGEDGSFANRDETEAAWARCLAELRIPDATLVRAMAEFPARRVYRQGERLYKIRLHGVGRVEGKYYADLAEEVAMVRRCHDIERVPEALEYVATDAFEAAAYRYVAARPFSECDAGVRAELSVLLQIAAVLLRLSWRGIAHNDVQDHNVLVTDDRRAYLVDFGLATHTSRLNAAFHNFCKFRRRRNGDHPFFASMAFLTHGVVTRHLPDRLVSAIRPALRTLGLRR